MVQVQDYELKAFFSHVVDVLERLGIPYMVVGGFAAIFYGEPRLTIDVDIVVKMGKEHVKPFVEAFPIPEYYVSEEGILDSLQRSYPFNVIHPSTGAKIDLVPLSEDPFTRGALQRCQRMEYDQTGRSAAFMSAEDVILAKLRAFRETGSEKHLRDARGVLVMQEGTLDVDALRQRAESAGVLTPLERLLAALRQ